MPKKVVDPTYAKSEEYRQILESISQGRNNCPFCPKHFKYHKQPILKVAGDWLITRNSWPYKNAAEHFLLISKIHKETLTELSQADLQAVLELAKWAETEFKLPGGGLTLRFGDTVHTGATVCHLHFHLIVPKINKRTGRAHIVRFPIG